MPSPHQLFESHPRCDARSRLYAGADAGIKCGEVLKRILLIRGVEGVGKVDGCYGEKRG